MPTRKELILSVFKGEEPSQVVWQPRIENWYDVNKNNGSLPDRFGGMSLVEVYDELDASPRPYVYPYPSPEDLRGDEGWGGYCPQYSPPVITVDSGPNVEGDIRKEDDFIIEEWKTPKGDLKRTWKHPDTSIVARVHEYPIQDIDDLEIMSYILEEQEWNFNKKEWKKVNERIGSRAQVAAISSRAPFQELQLFLWGYEKTILNLRKNPEKVENFLETAEDAKEQEIEMLSESPVNIICFGDNLDGRMIGPDLFQEYLLPYYQRFAPKLRDAGKYVYSHWDGTLKGILQFAKETGMNGLEALTPEPQGDVSIEEIHKALGDEMVLVDGIPATYFLPSVDVKKLEESVKKILETFTPNLVLGISDELPPDSEIERVELVSEMVREYNENQVG